MTTRSPSDAVSPSVSAPPLVLPPGPLAASTTAAGRYPVLSNRSIAWAAVALVVIGVGLAILLLVDFGDGRHTDQLAAVQTAGTIVVGTGGAAALWLTARRQRATEIALNQAKDAHALQEKVAGHARAYQDRVATATEADAQARRITDLYTKAADQIGSDKAPVRLAGLYALRRVAQDNADQRQTIVDVISAYLRMPYAEPDNEEHQVRLTAQRILATHLRPGADAAQPTDTFWPDVDVDLTGATLVDLDFSGCYLHTAQFAQATFVGDVNFGEARFDGSARFEGARFTGEAEFSGARFSDRVTFNETRFGASAGFNKARFVGVGYEYPSIDFRNAEFGGVTTFVSATFDRTVKFDNTRFGFAAKFINVKFNDQATFHGVSFAADVSFLWAEFIGGGMFNDVECAGVFGFDRTRFNSWSSFERAAVKLDNVNSSGLPLPGWKVVPSPDRAGWGTLVPGQPAGGSPRRGLTA